MRNLGRPLLRLLGRDDRGAIGVLVAVLIGGGVLLGMGALAIDVGQIYQNRAELQNGADAAALAIATQCANGACPAIPLNTAVTYAVANASALTQGAADVDCVYGSDSLTGGSCPTDVNSGSGFSNCPADPPAGTHFVDVQTETKLGNGSHLLPPVFAKTLVGSSTYNGTTVKACAQAEWGSSGPLAFTISTCEFNIASGGTTSQPGTLAWTSSGYPNPSIPGDVQYDTQFLVHSTGQDTDCPTGPANHAAPGAFGWTAGPSNPNTACVTMINSNNTYTADPGSSAKFCNSRLEELWKSRARTLLPVYVYGQITGNGSNTTYTLAGYLPMVITGFYIPGSNNPLYSAPDWLNPSLYSSCSGSTTCIDGYLLSDALLPPGSEFATPGTVKLTG